MLDVSGTYARRFGADRIFRQRMWKVLYEDFFRKYTPAKGTVVEIGTGYCEFINQGVGHRKIAVDLNPNLPSLGAPGLEVLVMSFTNLQGIATGSADLVFASNFSSISPRRT